MEYCSECNKEVKKTIKGLCDLCYQKEWHSKTIKCKVCGCITFRHAKGMCRSCYIKQYSPEWACSECNNHKHHFKNGMCQACYKRTPEGLILQMYGNMKYRSKLKDFTIIVDKYTFENFANNSSEFKELYNNWQNHLYDQRYTPSIDRVDNDKGYIVGNMQFITQSENSRKASRDGLGMARAVKLTMDGISTCFKSMSEASRYLGKYDGYVGNVISGRCKCDYCIDFISRDEYLEYIGKRN